MRVYVELSRGVDAASWAEENAAGRAADATPYGLHHLERHGHVVRFRRPLRTRVAQRISEVTENRLWGMQLARGLAALKGAARRSADVILCMDERNGLPAAFIARRTPVVTGVAWLEDPEELPPVYRALARRGLSRAAGVFVECSAMLDPLRDRFGVSPDKLHYIHLGIDEQHFSPSPTPPIPRRVFSVGDDRMRDYDTLVAALDRVHGDIPTMTAEIATTLPTAFPAWATVHRRRMDDAVRECYHRASVVALALKPTRQGSGLTVILEAMASARPVVVTDNPGLSDYVVDGETGLLVPPGDSAAMADAVRALFDDPARAEEMGRRGRARVERLFTTAEMAASLDGVLREATSREALGTTAPISPLSGPERT